MRSTNARRASSWADPPARRMAPSTPPPPMSPLFAALTTASTSWVVMSPRTIVMRRSGTVHGLGIRADPAGTVECGQDRHLVRAEFEVEDREVLADALGAHRLRDCDDTELQMPAQYHLRR